jgi:hypothetical protein
MHHYPGTSMSKCDALSRRANHANSSNNNCNTTLLRSEFFMVHALEGMNRWSKRHLEEIKTILHLYMREQSKVKSLWIAALAQATQAHGKKPGHARNLQSHTRKFVESCTVLVNLFGAWTKSRIKTDKKFAQDINLHLQSLGKYVKAHNIVTYLDQPDVKLKWGLKKTISDATAKRWMNKLGYHWVKKHHGMYVDGHKQEDVVQYQQSVFLPAWYKVERHMQSWTSNNEKEPSHCSSESDCHIVA